MVIGIFLIFISSLQLLKREFSEGIVVIFIIIIVKYCQAYFPSLKLGIIILFLTFPFPSFKIVNSFISPVKLRYCFVCSKAYLGRSLENVRMLSKISI